MFKFYYSCLKAISPLDLFAQFSEMYLQNNCLVDLLFVLNIWFSNYESALYTSWAAKTLTYDEWPRLQPFIKNIFPLNTTWLDQGRIITVDLMFFSHRNSGFILPNITANKKGEKIFE